MNTIFWNVDTQRDFCLPSGKLYIKGAEDINDKLRELTTFARENGIKVVNTADYHTKDSKEISATPDFKTTFPEHCMAWDEGHEFIQETYPKYSDGQYCIVNNFRDEDIDTAKFNMSRNIIILKDSFDVFEGNRCAEVVLDLLKPDLIVVYGIVSEICINYAVRGLLARINDFRKYDVVIAIDAIWALDNSAMNIYNLYQDWLMEGAWLASVASIKKFVKRDLC